METLEDVLQHRLRKIREAISVEVTEEQRHLDGGSPEREYWHYGYASALKDVLTMLQSAGGTPN